MITLSNGHVFQYMVASGALAFDGYGWPWERPLVAVGLIKPELFTVVIKTLTRNPRKGNLKVWRPWSCVRLLDGNSAVNKVGLTNPGIDWWREKIGPHVDRRKLALVGSIFGDRKELVEMARILNNFDLVGLEINASCPNTGHPMGDVQMVVDDVRAVKDVSHHPIIIKLSVAQDYCEIVSQLEGIAEGVALNSVPWEIVYAAPNGKLLKRSPLWPLEKKVGGGGGGVSGKQAQKYNWLAVNQLAVQVHAMDVIAPSIMEIEDIDRVKILGARAVSFGSIHMRTPCKPTEFVERRLLWKE